ncbi:MAG: tetratricopeptide repeat protein [Thermodesulfobacteriota bacterium]
MECQRLMAIGHRGEALACCEQALSALPHSAELLFLAGCLLGKAGRHAEARRRYQESLNERTSVHALRGLASLFEESGEWTEAAHLLRRAVAMDPSDPNSIMDLGLCLLQAACLADARAAFEAALALQPDSYAHRFFLAETLYRMGSLQEACVIFESLRRAADHRQGDLPRALNVRPCALARLVQIYSSPAAGSLFSPRLAEAAQRELAAIESTGDSFEPTDESSKGAS